MNKLLLFFTIFAAIFLCSALTQAQYIKEDSFKAYGDPSSSFIHLEWSYIATAGIDRIDVLRSADVSSTKTFQWVTSLEPSVTSFDDYSALMKTQAVYTYSLQVYVTGKTTPAQTITRSVNHSVSGVRRTWGSIKAMFR